MSTSFQPSFTPDQEAFRHEVRSWLETNTPSEPTPRDQAAQVGFLRAWQAKLSAQGYVATHWPVVYGGAGRGWSEHFIVQEELARAGAPEIINRIAVNLVSPVLINHGTEEQRQKYLPRLLRADDIWCQLFSEPGAGSDLRSLTTTATRTEGGWTVRGQKLWSSWAHHARYGVLLARTDVPTEGPGVIGYFVVDMDQRGVEARPVRQMTGDAEFCEVFFDDAFIPEENVIGSPNDGWRIVGTTLNYERSLSPRQLITHANLLQELIDQARNQVLPAEQRQRLARAYSELLIYRLHLYRVLTILERGEQPTATSSIVKLFWSEMAQRMHELSVDMLGPGLLSQPSARQRAWLYYRSCTIFAGTSEIQRNTLGERVLGMPRGRAARSEESVTMSDNILLERQDGISLVTLNRPDRLNAFDPTMAPLLEDVLERAHGDPDSRVIVITGAGRGFCAGGDVGAFGSQPDHRVNRRGWHLVQTILAVEKPTIAMINGAAIGVGLTIALLCDMAIAADGAQLGDTHVNLGLVAGDGAAIALPLLIGPQKAKELLLTGRLVSGAEAAELGLVNASVPAEALGERVFELARRLAGQPPYALRATKMVVNRYVRWMTHQVLDVAMAYEEISKHKPEHAEAVQRWRERQS